MSITTSLVLPAVPSDRFDWCASVDDTDGEVCAFGPTEVKALRALCDELWGRLCVCHDQLKDAR